MDRMTRSEEYLRSALHRPEDDPAGVARVMNDRGLRDGLVVLACRSRDWGALAAAAQLAGRHAAATGGHSVYGPLTVLGVARWMSPGGERDPEVPLIWAAVPEDDPAHRMALLASRVHGQDSDGEMRDDWAVRLAAIDIRQCLAFRSAAAPASAAPLPPAVERWLSGASIPPSADDPLAAAGVPLLRFGPEPETSR